MVVSRSVLVVVVGGVQSCLHAAIGGRVHGSRRLGEFAELFLGVVLDDPHTKRIPQNIHSCTKSIPVE